MLLCTSCVHEHFHGGLRSWRLHHSSLQVCRMPLDCTIDLSYLLCRYRTCDCTQASKTSTTLRPVHQGPTLGTLQKMACHQSNNLPDTSLRIAMMLNGWHRTQLWGLDECLRIAAEIRQWSPLPALGVYSRHNPLTSFIWVSAPPFC